MESRGTAPELRAELERTRNDLSAKSKAIVDLEAKIKDYEKRGIDTEALTKRLETRERDYEALEARLRLKEFEASDDFKKNHELPFKRAANYAANTIRGLVKTDGTQADFAKDFEPIYRLPYNAAYARAREVFGEDGAVPVMEHVRELQKLDMASREAMAEEKENWKVNVEREQGERVQRQEKIKSLVAKVRKDLQDATEDYRDPVGDKEIEEARSKGYQIFDYKPKTLDQAIVRDEHVRHRVAAHLPLKLMLARKDKEIAELKSQLEKHKPKVPGERTPRSPGGERTAAAEPESYEDYLMKEVEH